MAHASGREWMSGKRRGRPDSSTAAATVVPGGTVSGTTAWCSGSAYTTLIATPSPGSIELMRARHEGIDQLTAAALEGTRDQQRRHGVGELEAHGQTDARAAIAQRLEGP